MARSLMSADFFEIGWFQIENLMINQMKFVLFDLRPGAEHPVEPKALWSHALKVPPTQAVELARAKLGSAHDPLLLLCSDGRTSGQVAADLVKAGFTNIFVIEGGYQKLLSEFDRTTGL